MAEVVEELITRITIDTAQALKNAQEIRSTVDAMKIKLRELAETSKLSFKDLGAGMIASIKGMGFEQLKTIFPQLNNDVRSVAQAQQTLTSAVRTATTELTKESQVAKELHTEARKGQSIFQKLGTVMQLAFGLGIYSMIMKISNALKQAIQSGYELSKAMFQLAVGTNALRRAGIDIHLADIYQNLDKLQKKFGVFSKKELIEGAAAFMNLVRDMGFTKEQIFELQDAVATLAVVNGRAMDEVQRTVALALSSGYTEGLQRLGVSINRVNIAIKAEELGYGRVYMSLTEAQRAEATQILILQKTAKYSNDLTAYQKSLAGQIDKTTAAITDQKAALGKLLLPTKLFGLAIVEFVIDKIGIAAKVLSSFGSLVWLAAETFAKSADLIKGKLSIKEYEEEIKRIRKLTADMMSQTWSGAADTGVDEAALAKIEAANKEIDEIMDATAELTKELMDLEDEKVREIAETEKKFWEDMEKINEDGLAKQREIWDKYYADMNKIRQGRDKDITDATKKELKDEAQTNRDFNNKRAESEAKYRENQIKEEIDYQERLKKLREGFLMDLEDALRERDALQVLRAIRQYNLQKKQATREHDIALDEMKRSHALELQELEKQRAERLRNLREELADKVASIREEADIRIREAEEARNKELAELSKKIQEEKDKRQAAFDEEITDLNNKFADRLAAIALNLALEYKLTDEQITNIISLYDKLDARVAKAWRDAGAWIAAYNAKLAMLQPLISPLYNQKPAGGGGMPGRAKGGIDFANKPTSLKIGDAGPEMAITMPLSRSFSGDQYLNGNPISSLSGGGNSSIDIALLLSPDLEARIVRKSGDTVANVLLEVQRQR